jgi:hypothetical protein
VDTFTTSPALGACTIMPPPMYIPTWWIDVQSLRLEAKNSRSPGSRLVGATIRPRVA